MKNIKNLEKMFASKLFIHNFIISTNFDRTYNCNRFIAKLLIRIFISLSTSCYFEIFKISIRMLLNSNIYNLDNLFFLLNIKI